MAVTGKEHTLNEAPVQHNQIQVTKPGLLASIKWAVMRGLLSTVGRASKGVRIGYTYGFDSGTMLDYVYVNKAQGFPFIGTLIDRCYLNAVGWRAIRARRALLKELLRDEVRRRAANGAAVRLLDVAAGPGRYLQELLQECTARGEVRPGALRILCRDLSTDGLAQGKRLAEEAGLLDMHYEQGNAFDPAPTDAQLGGAPDIIVVSGLYELILDDDTIRRSLAQLYHLLAPGGALFFTTQTHHPQLEFIANVLPNRDGALWVMKCRPAALLEDWTRRAGFEQVQSRLEEVGLFTVTVARKA